MLVYIFILQKGSIMKKIIVSIIISGLFIFSVLPQAVEDMDIESDLLSDLMAVADDTVAVIKDNLPSSQGETQYISITAIKYNNSPSQLGVLFGYMLTTRIVNSDIPGIAIIPEYNSSPFVPFSAAAAEEPINISYKVFGNIFRVGDKIYLGIQLFKESNNTVLAASEKVLPLYPEILSLLSISNDIATGSGGDMYEPNDDPSFASVLIPGETISGLTISPEEDYDWFQMDLSGVLMDDNFNSVVVETQSTMDTYIEVYGPNDPYYYITDNDDSGMDSNARVTVLIDQPGIYYFKVKAYYSDTTGNYSLVSSFQQIVVDEGEPNNYQAEAELLTEFGGDLVKSFSPSGDEDWYFFNAETMDLGPGSFVIIETLGSLDTLLSIYDESGYEIMNDDDSGTDSNARVDLYINDYNSYYIKVSPYDYGTVGEYRLRIYVD